MSERYEVRCDACDADLTYTWNCQDWRLLVTAEEKATDPEAQVVTMMGLRPPVSRDHQFCDTLCLARWLATEHPTALQEYDAKMERRRRAALRTQPKQTGDSP